MRRLIGGSALRTLIAEVGLALVVLGVIEAGFRWYVAHGSHELFPALFRSSLTTAKFLQFRQRAREGRPLDLLIMGTSQMTRVHAALLTDMLSARDCPTSAFNFAAPGHSVAFDLLLLERLLLDVTRPRVLLYGVIPSNALREPSFANADLRARDLPGFQLERGSASAWLNGFLLDHVALFRYREAIAQWLSVDGARLGEWERVARDVDGYGDLPLAFLQGGPPTDLNPAEKEFQKQLQSFSHLLSQTPLFRHIEMLAERCRIHDIQLVLLVNPVAPIFLRQLQRGMDDYREFLDRIRTAAAALHVAVLFPADDGIAAPQYFVDTVHYNTEGTRWLTESVATLLTRSTDSGSVLPCRDGAPRREGEPPPPTGAADSGGRPLGRGDSVF